ncbi:hypothetical protein B0H63DRAFT_527630 [Podospora didyma]|uniref:Uncharacterized protein n=1 Tax=Podospora didyma TaxID=330526 RepID=A0AAE0K4E7_9PEZI|nr:hypothetical protein B0H63DRAFT_527630 [Podospora didyma]
MAPSQKEKPFSTTPPWQRDTQRPEAAASTIPPPPPPPPHPPSPPPHQQKTPSTSPPPTNSEPFPGASTFHSSYWREPTPLDPPPLPPTPHSDNDNIRNLTLRAHALTHLLATQYADPETEKSIHEMTLFLQTYQTGLPITDAQLTKLDTLITRRESILHQLNLIAAGCSLDRYADWLRTRPATSWHLETWLHDERFPARQEEWFFIQDGLWQNMGGDSLVWQDEWDSFHFPRHYLAAAIREAEEHHYTSITIYERAVAFLKGQKKTREEAQAQLEIKAEEVAEEVAPAVIAALETREVKEEEEDEEDEDGRTGGRRNRATV